MKFSLLPVLTLVAAASVSVRAQNISQCVLNCITQAASANGCSLQQPQCLCTNTKLQQEALSCLQQSCTAQDLQTAESLVQTECGSFGTPPLSADSSAAASATNTAPSSESAASTGTSSGAAPAVSQTQSQSQSSNAAVSTAFSGGKMGAVVVAVAVGAVVGL